MANRQNFCLERDNEKRVDLVGYKITVFSFYKKTVLCSGLNVQKTVIGWPDTGSNSFFN